MSLCGIMQDDFLEGWGRYDETTGTAGYDLRDVEFGITFAVDYQAAGWTREPIHGYDLAAFEAWCRERAAELSTR